MESNNIFKIVRENSNITNMFINGNYSKVINIKFTFVKECMDDIIEVYTDDIKYSSFTVNSTGEHILKIPNYNSKSFGLNLHYDNKSLVYDKTVDYSTKSINNIINITYIVNL